MHKKEQTTRFSEPLSLEDQNRQLTADNRFFKDRFNQLASGTRDAVMLARPCGTIISANPSAGTLLGMAGDGPIRQNLFSILFPAGSGLEKLPERIQLTGEFTGILTIRPKPGERIRAEVSARAVTDRNGQRCISIIIRNPIPARGETLPGAPTAPPYRQVFNHIGLGVIIFRPEAGALTVTDINPAAEQIFQIPRQKALGQCISSLFPDAGQHRLDHYTALVQTTRTPVQLPVPVFSGEPGARRCYEAELYPLPWDGIVSVFKNVTQRDKALAALRESEAKFQIVTQTINDGLALFSGDGEVLTWNKGAENITAIKAGDLMGKNSQTLRHLYEAGRFRIVQEDGAPCRYEDLPSIKTLCTGVPVTNQIIGIVLASGRIRWVLENTFPLFRGTSQTPYLVCLSFSDITDLKNSKADLEQEIRQRTGQLDEMNHALKVLLKKREQDLEDIEKNLLANCDALIMPMLVRLKAGLDDPALGQMIDVIRSNLETVLSPFSKQLGTPLRRLTPAEIQISAMITQGFSNKEMAQVLDVSVRTITNHRDNIRNKLNLKNTKINLRSYLSSLT